MKVSVIHRLASVCIFEVDNAVNYDSSCQVFKYGDRGMVFTINGRAFYKVLKEQIKALMEQLEVKTLEGYVTDSHAKLMRRELRGVASVTDRGRGQMDGHDMVWIVVEAL